MERQKLKLAFSEVIEGYSVAISDSFGDIRIKHINNSDSAKTDIKNNFYFPNLKCTQNFNFFERNCFCTTWLYT